VSTPFFQPFFQQFHERPHGGSKDWVRAPPRNLDRPVPADAPRRSRAARIVLNLDKTLPRRFIGVVEKRLKLHLRGGKFQGVTPERSRQMSAIRARNNRSTERRLKAAIAQASIGGWTLHPRDVTGRPDFWFPETRLAILVDGCFWHGCPKCGHYPRTRAAFWKAKISRNRERDRMTSRKLRQSGCRVLRFWEHEIQQNLKKCVERVRALVT